MNSDLGSKYILYFPETKSIRQEKQGSNIDNRNLKLFRFKRSMEYSEPLRNDS